MGLRALFEAGAPLLFGAMSGWLGGGDRGLMGDGATTAASVEAPAKTSAGGRRCR